MSTVVEAVYENGVLKPLVAADFKEQHLYKVLLEEPTAKTEPQSNGAATSERPDTYCLREMQWLSQHRHEYAGQYVALDGDRLVSHGTDGREVYRQARAAGVKVPFMAHIEPADALPFGGW